MTRLVGRVLPLVATLVLLGAAGAGAVTDQWSQVKQVTVKSLNGSLPPGKQNPRTLRFTTPKQLDKVTKALIANRIVRRSGPGDPGACAGGMTVTITIAAATKQTKLTSYVCGNATYGTAAGNVKGFLKAVGLKLNS